MGSTLQKVNQFSFRFRLKRFPCNLQLLMRKEEENRGKGFCVIKYGNQKAIMENWSNFSRDFSLSSVHKPVSSTESFKSEAEIRFLFCLFLLYRQFRFIDKLTLDSKTIFFFSFIIRLKLKRSVWLTEIFIDCDRFTSGECAVCGKGFLTLCSFCCAIH